MKNNEILSILFSVIPEDRVDSVTWYGNRKGKDKDLFVVIKNDYRYGVCVYGDLDICLVGKEWMPTLIHNLDPTVTEPLLTGEDLFGKTDLYKESLLKTPVTEDTPIYFLECAEIFYEWAVGHAFNGEIRYSLFTLNFVYSYILYAFRYYKGSDLVLFRQILSDMDGVWITRNRKIAKENWPFMERHLSRAFNDTRKVLTDLRVVVGL